jgi:uncharacterized protein (DUF342 family)
MVVDNPLKKILPVEDRLDGVYIKVAREAKDSIRIEAIAAALQNAFVTNFDLEKIKDVVSRARGGFEKIGPIFEFYNPELDQFVDINVESLNATMHLKEGISQSGIKLSDTALVFCLKRKGIIFGLLTDAIRDIAKSCLVGKDVVIAKGKPAVNGENAKISFEIDLDKAVKPKEDELGHVDYRDINSIAQVSKGQIIAKKEPPTPGTPGKDVTGKELPPVPGGDTIMRGGQNTEVTPDGKQLKALVSGYIYKKDDVVHISEQLSIKNNVDFSVGNIKYSGDIKIEGDILPGFTIETGGNVTIKGEAESAKIISRDGSVVVGKGVVGKNDMSVSAKKDVHLAFAQGSLITAEGDVLIDKFCMHCVITANNVTGTHPTSSIIAGTCTVFSHMEIGSLGNETGVETRVKLVDKEEHAAEEKIRQLEDLKAKLELELEPVKKQIRTKAAIFKQAGAGVTQRQADEMKKWLETFNTMTAKVKYVQEKITELNEVLKKPRNRTGYIKVLGTVFPGTELNLYGITKVIKETMTNKVFKVKEGAVGVEG